MQPSNYEPEGRQFDSVRAHHLFQSHATCSVPSVEVFDGYRDKLPGDIRVLQT
jgi:hypothetical protein